MAQENEVVNVKPSGVVTINVGVPGIPGVPGQSFRFDDLTEEQKAELKGPKGDSLRFEDLTEDQKAELRGPKGDLGTPGTADTTYHALLEGNVWCESASVDHVLMAVLGNSGKPFPRTSFKELKVLNTFRGQKVIGIEGEPHYTVKVGEHDFTISKAGNGNITLDEPLADDDVKLTYHNFTGAKVGEFTIAGIPDDTAAQPDDTYTDSGSKYFKYGRKLVIDVTNQTTTSSWSDGKDFKFLGKWSELDIDSIEINTRGKKQLYIYILAERRGTPIPSNTPIFVNKPELISFYHLTSPTGNRMITIGTKGDGLHNIDFMRTTLGWNSASHQYINTGDEPL